uniref:Ty3/gypsy retrotransposon protein n=1 Tax=Tanacetum cinerariifolium TaxID=118510 RepID=A0A699HJF0_TANCI|nr:Ty3/gypsy retrotransposon protein [Tanacetum cinerariifolium]
MKYWPVPTNAKQLRGFLGLTGYYGRFIKGYATVAVDRLTKYAHFIAMAHPFTASQVAQLFLDNIYKLHGLPESIVSDRDNVFIKVLNKSLECYLRCICGEKPKEWCKWLPLAKWWYNTNYHSTLNTTPYEILYGQIPPIHIPYVPGESRVDTVDRTLAARE